MNRGKLSMEVHMGSTNVIDILEQLEGVGGRLEKESILKRNRDNKLLKKALIAALDPYVVYYVNKFKMPKSGQGAREYDNDEALTYFLKDLLPKLSSRKLTGNNAKDAVVACFSHMTELQQKWCQRIILRNLRAGVQGSTVNKIWPDTIKGFKVQLAETLKTSHDKEKGIILEEEVQYPVHVEPKLDGLRLIVIKKNGDVSMYTRNGTVLDTLPSITAEIASHLPDGWVLDGEAMGDDWNESSSVLMSSKTKKDDVNMVFNVFDAITVAEWEAQMAMAPLKTRVETVHELLAHFPKKTKVVQVKGATVHNDKELMSFYSATMDGNYEGIMIKDLTATYKFKRSDGVLKMKPVATYEGVIVGHYLGKRGTKREDVFGGFNVLFPTGAITNVGGGFKDELKAEIQLNGPDTYIGKIAEVEGQPDPATDSGLTKDGKVRFPVFMRFRDASDVDPKVLEVYDEFKAMPFDEAWKGCRK